MKSRHIILLSLLVSAILFAWMTWPLGEYFHAGMPASHRPEAGGPRAMIAGDHLQFLFQLWMLADAIEGKTPLFYHIYEFNQGNDEDRREVGTYYFPFGLMYAAGQFVGGRAVGWNVMLFVTAWLTYLMTWVLARRFCRSALAAAVAALPGLLLPYMWTSTLGGSPTGLGMMWVPVIFYGIDVAVRDRRIWGGILAGVALFVSPWGDLHVFFFAFLAAPIWMAFCLFWAMEQGTWSFRGRRWRDLLIPVIPFVVLMGVAYLQTALVKQGLSGSAQSKGRSVAESVIFAPRWEGLFAWDPANRFNMIYLGWVVVAVLLAGLLLLAADAWRRRHGGVNRLLVFCLFLASIFGIVLLALGPNIPFDSHNIVWQGVRKVLPPYKMIRQPAKVFCILAPFLTVALAMALDRLQALFTRRSAAAAFLVIVGVAMSWDYGRRIDPTICLLDYEQGAYRAVAEDAAQCGRDNRAMSIPIWPGDSHWNSLTEYYATLYRTKMLNGYRPTIRLQYRADIFDRLVPMNLGLITDDRLDALLERKIGYLVLQEDAFPDKVSPFAVSQTLDALLHHPRIELLARDAEIWAFKILDAGAERKQPLQARANDRPWLAARWWWVPEYAATNAVLETNEKGDVTGVQLTRESGPIQLPPRYLHQFDNLRYVVAARGNGTLRGSFQADSNSPPVQVTAPVKDQWSWIELPVPKFHGASDTILALSAAHGSVTVGSVTLLAGPWPWLKPGASLPLRADTFFRAGYSELQDGSVHLRVERDPADVVFYAPAIPLVQGRYRVTVDFDSPGRPGTEVGSASVLRRRSEVIGSCPLIAGQPASFEITHDSPRLLRFDLRYTRAADLTIRGVTVTRVE